MLDNEFDGRRRCRGRGSRWAWVAALLVVAPLGPEAAAAQFRAEVAFATAPAPPLGSLPAAPGSANPFASVPRPEGVPEETAAEIGGGSRAGSLEVRIVEYFQSDRLQENRALRHGATAFDILGLPGSAIIAAALFGAGEIQGREGLRDLGLQSGQALVLAQGIVFTGKAAVGRARPRVHPRDPGNVSFGRGLSGGAYRSFPSGHSAGAFAVASALSWQLAERNPGNRLRLDPLLFGSAALAGTARIYHEEHWASDVAAGALIGLLSGWAVTR
jgi:membrane-associated phospholipid phosphatase